MPHSTSSPVVRTLVALAPLCLSLGFGWALMGWLSLGGGDKDLLLAFPLLLWSLIFLLVSLGLWWRRVRLRPTIAWAAGVATVLVAAGLAALIALSP